MTPTLSGKIVTNTICTCSRFHLISILLNPPLELRLSTRRNSSPWTLHSNEDHSRTNDSNILWESNAAEWLPPPPLPWLPQEELHWDVTASSHRHKQPITHQVPTDALDFIDLRPECGCCHCSGDAPGIRLSNRRESCKPSRPWLTLIRVQCLNKSPVYLLFRSQPGVQKGTKRAFFLWINKDFVLYSSHQSDSVTESIVPRLGGIFFP